jgi:glutamine---fructose-6-phosphate transaminase (isomerizing)
MQISNTGAIDSATLNEILSQAEAWQQSLSELKHSATLERFLQESQLRTEWLFVGCGTSFYLAEVAAGSWTLLTGQRARALPASEPLLFPGLISPKPSSLQAVVISRSGQTSEALRAAELLSRKFKVPTLGITCTADSALEEACDNTLRISTAEEKSTVMTRSFTSMLLAVQYVAARKSANESFISALERMACHFAAQIRSLSDRIAAFVNEHSFGDYVFLGQGPFYGIAREASLKVTEMSCSYSQVFHTLEFRHGPMAIVSPETCLTFFLSESGYQAECEVLAEMKELGGVTIAVCDRANDAIRQSCDLLFEFGFEGPEVATLAPFVVPAQLLGFFTGIKKKLNPDHPKNLTRVVIL